MRCSCQPLLLQDRLSRYLSSRERIQQLWLCKFIRHVLRPASCVTVKFATSCKSLHDEHAHARAKILNTFKLIQFIWIDVLSRTQEHRIALRSYDSKRELMVVSPCYLFNMFAQAKKWLQAISQTQRLAPQRAKASGINSRPKMSQASSIVGYVGLRRDFPTGQSTAQLTGAVSSKSQESQLLLFASFLLWVSVSVRLPC